MNSFLQIIIPLLLTTSLISCRNHSSQKSFDSRAASKVSSDFVSIIDVEKGDFDAYKTQFPLKIDGLGADSIWISLDWYGMNYIWMGESVDSLDYHGKFKLAWDSQNLYVLVEVVDDSLQPTLGNGLEHYWKGDYVELFIDEDKSGGVHQFNHQAFAYHVSTEGHAIDLNTSKEPVFFDDHIMVERSQEGNRHVWEMAIQLFDDQFDENASDHKPVEIVAKKRIGFSIAYGDNDGNNSREHFMGSKKSHGQNNDEGYINSDVLGSILFME
jgi:hypothetical protein